MPQNRNNSEFLTPFKQALIKSSLSARLLIIYTSLKLWRIILAVNIILCASVSGRGWGGMVGGWCQCSCADYSIDEGFLCYILLMRDLLLPGPSACVFFQRSGTSCMSLLLLLLLLLHSWQLAKHACKAIFSLPACFNPLNAMPAAPLHGKRPIKVQNVTPLRFFGPSHAHLKGFLSKCTVLKVNLLQEIRYAVWRRVCVHFSARKFYWLAQ